MSARPGDRGEPLSSGADPAEHGQPAEDLLPVVYAELRRLARERLKKTPPGNTLQATALVHEAYLRLVGDGDPGWNGRGHFFGAAARAMRDLLVDQARRKAAAKRGGGARRVAMEAAEIALAGEDPELDLLALDDALRRLEARKPEKARIVELRYFAGLNGAETAAVLGVSERTVERAWRYAKAWLRREIEGTGRGSSDG